MTHHRFEFSQILLNWYNVQKRNLPWRHTTNPYYIWLSEVILQQTRVVQGLPYYQDFVKAFPTIEDLANASEEKVLKLWQGLGYYSRAKNLHETAKIVAYTYQGVFPKTYDEIIKLKGIGDYTASAIASICYQEPRAVVDGNVYRVLSRIFDIEIPINSSKGNKYFKALATELLDKEKAGLYNQAIMDFGAVQCKPQSPDCQQCVFSEKCLAYVQNKISQLPVKTGKTKVRNRYFHYCMVLDQENKTTIFQKRKNKDIWQGLYEFPLIEFAEEVSDLEVIKLIQANFPEIISIEKKSEKILHKLSHQNIYSYFWIISVKKIHKNAICLENINNFPTSILLANFLKNLQI